MEVTHSILRLKVWSAISEDNLRVKLVNRGYVLSISAKQVVEVELLGGLSRHLPLKVDTIFKSYEEQIGKKVEQNIRKR